MQKAMYGLILLHILLLTANGLGRTYSYGEPGNKTIVVKPAMIDDVLYNPGKGFMTHQRFNGDKLAGREGYENVGDIYQLDFFPMRYQEFDGDLQKYDEDSWGGYLGAAAPATTVGGGERRCQQRNRI